MNPLRAALLRGSIVFGLLLVGSAVVRGASIATVDPPVLLVAPDSSRAPAEFEVRTIPRANFALPLPVKLSEAPRPTASSVHGLAPGEMDSPTSWRSARAQLYRSTGRLRGAGSSGRGPRSNETQLRFGAEGLVTHGVLSAEVDAVERDGDRRLSRALIGLDTYSGWRVTAGDLRAVGRGPVAHGLTARGIRLERTSRPGGEFNVTAEMLIGRAPVRYENLVANRFPRQVGLLRMASRLASGLSATAQWAHFSDRASSEVIGSWPIRVGRVYGLGVEGSYRRVRADVIVSQSREKRDAFPLDVGTMLDTRLRGAHRRLTWSVRNQSTRGRMHEIGSMGVVTNVPRGISTSDLTLRLGPTSSLGLSGGRWLYRPYDPTREPDVSPDSLVFRQDRADRGWNWGGKLDLRVPHAGTKLSFERDRRHRESNGGTQEITVHSLSATHNFSPGASATLRWHRFGEERAGSSQYLTGGANIALPRSASLFVQQQTAWQEPSGLRLISLAELSSIALWRSCPLTLRFTQTHERLRGLFQPAETRGSLSARLRLGSSTQINASYEVVTHPHQQRQTVLVAASRFFGAGTKGPSANGDRFEPAARQVMGGVVFEDRNRDGFRQDDEPGVSGIAVVVDNEAREPAVSGPDGRYRAVVAPGRHLVRLLSESVPTSFTLDDLETVEVLIDADRLLDFDFPLVRRVGWIAGRVVLEEELNTRVPGRERRKVARIRIVLDDHAFTYTDDEGRFEFRALPAGEHEVVIDGETVPPGLRIVGTSLRQVPVTGELLTGSPCTFTLARPIHRTVFE